MCLLHKLGFLLALHRALTLKRRFPVKVGQTPITAAELDELRAVLSGLILPINRRRIVLVAGDLALEQL
jgi:hypothetical protein